MSTWLRKYLTSLVAVLGLFVVVDRAIYATEPSVPVSVETGNILQGGVEMFGLQFTKGIVEQFELHLDKATPLILAGISAYYYKEKNIEKATFYYQAALLRMNIDAKIVPDELLDDFPAMITMLLGDFFFEFEKTKKLFIEHLDALLKAKIEVVEWDKKTPRNYAMWEIINQDHDKVKTIIEEQYKSWDKGITDLTNEVMSYKQMLADYPDNKNVSKIFNDQFEKLTKENNSFFDDKKIGDFKDKDKD